MFKSAVITASDKGAAGTRADKTTPAVCRLLEEHGYEVVETRLLPDDAELLKNAMIELADDKSVPLILTTGGTGFSPRDCTPEATLAVIEREAPGIAEAMRMMSMQVTPRAMLSRAVSGIRGGSLIINLPGSPKAAAECLGFVIGQLEHGLRILRGLDGECAARHTEK